MRVYRYLAITGLALTLGACAQQPTQEQTGAMVGGVLGGLLGTQVGSGRGTTAAIIAGTLGGALIGGALGRNMDEVDRMQVARTLETVPDSRTVAWTNPNTGNQFQATPTSTYQSAGRDCREFQVIGTVNGSAQPIYGTACRDASGRWINQ